MREIKTHNLSLTQKAASPTMRTSNWQGRIATKDTERSLETFSVIKFSVFLFYFFISLECFSTNLRERFYRCELDKNRHESNSLSSTWLKRKMDANIGWHRGTHLH